MAIEVHKLIAAICPDLYCDASVRDEVKKIAKEEGYLKAAEKAALPEAKPMDLNEIKYANPIDKKGLKAPFERHTLIYDSFGESLEPIYFWILDKMNEECKKVDKLVDNFVSSAGSGHFSELGMKASKMQEEAMKWLGNANTVLKLIINILYDLKEFKMRLALYEDYNTSKDKAKKNAALLSLKQIWMDTVDIKRGNTSIKGLATQNFDYVTLIDAFMAAESLEKVTLPPQKGGLDLNERIRRLLQQRLGEFFDWLKLSEEELRKRYEIERAYLRSQVNSVKLYSRWAKPYLRAAQKLEQRADENASLVTTFNTSLMELVLLGEIPYKPEDDVKSGELPKSFKNVKARKYSSIVIVEFRFRSIPERTERGYGFRGRTEIVFTGYGLNEDELKTLREELEKDDLGDMLQLIEGATTESLDKISEDINFFLSEEGNQKEEKKEKEEKNSGDTNPFSALFEPISNLFKKEEKGEKDKGIASDSFMEKIIRSQAIIEARKKCSKIYDSFKKSKSMPTL